MKIANGVAMLDIQTNLSGKPGVIHPTLIWDQETTILVDAGMPGRTPLGRIREAMAGEGVPFDRLNKVIITHQDIDHIGGLPDILEASQHPVEVLAHEGDQPYIEGEKRLIKITDKFLAQMETWPEELRKFAKPIFENPPHANVDHVVVDSEELPYCGGIIVIHMPGHTPGHICLYLKQSRTLIAGDTLNVADGRLLGPNPQHTLKMDQALNSLKKLARYDIDTVICYHGGLYRGKVNQQIAELAAGQP
jgi:glyoxylase-like metal-dependent hydrolase (beta-lactamase superfamily II)